MAGVTKVKIPDLMPRGVPSNRDNGGPVRNRQIVLAKALRDMGDAVNYLLGARKKCHGGHRLGEQITGSKTYTFQIEREAFAGALAVSLWVASTESGSGLSAEVEITEPGSSVVLEFALTGGLTAVDAVEYIGVLPWGDQDGDDAGAGTTLPLTVSLIFTVTSGTIFPFGVTFWELPAFDPVGDNNMNVG